MINNFGLGIFPKGCEVLCAAPIGTLANLCFRQDGSCSLPDNIGVNMKRKSLVMCVRKGTGELGLFNLLCSLIDVLYHMQSLKH